jgi:hypothetical protein
MKMIYKVGTILLACYKRFMCDLKRSSQECPVHWSSRLACRAIGSFNERTANRSGHPII